MQYTIFINRAHKTFVIAPENLADLNKILTSEAFIPVQNSLVVFNGNIWGKIDSELHLNFAIAFVYHRDNQCTQVDTVRDDVSVNKRITIRRLYELKNAAFAQPPTEGIYVSYRTQPVKMEHYNSAGFQAAIFESTNSEPFMVISFNFNNLEQVRAVNQFLTAQNMANAEIAAREKKLTTQQVMLTGGKEAFVAQLKSHPSTDWPKLFQDAFAAKQVHVPAFSSDFSWIDSDEYTSKIASIIADYDVKKGLFRKVGYFGFVSPYSSIMTTLQGSATLTSTERKEKLADYFADLVFETNWDKRKAQQPELSVSAKAILGFKI